MGESHTCCPACRAEDEQRTRRMVNVLIAALRHPIQVKLDGKLVDRAIDQRTSTVIKQMQGKAKHGRNHR